MRRIGQREATERERDARWGFGGAHNEREIVVVVERNKGVEAKQVKSERESESGEEEKVEDKEYERWRNE